MQGEPLENLLSAIDPGASRIIKLPSRIWVFGGPCNLHSDTPSSLRDSFWRTTLSAEDSRYPWLSYLDRPEQYDDWWAFSGYDDLLEFERDACYLAKATILFAESPGALAELGALAIDSHILTGLLVIVQSKYLREGQRESFLNLGPLKRVEKRKNRCVIGSTVNSSLPTEDFEDIANFITNLSSPHNSEILRPDNPTHRLLLLADLVDILLVSTETDLRKAIDGFQISIPETDLSRALSLLAFLGFIRREDRGNAKYWTRRKSSEAPWLDYKAKSGTGHFDRSRFKARCLERILEDPRRRSIYEASR